MAKRLTVEQRLAELEMVRSDPQSQDSLQLLSRALSQKRSLLVARAAKLTGEFGLDALCGSLVETFDRLIDEGYEKDKGCRAKAAVVEALQLIGTPEDGVYLRGARYVQMEPVWGGRADTAGPLRSASAIGLVRMNHHESLIVLADLLADPMAPVRADAARTLAYRGAPDGLPLLRMRVRIGDEDSDVITECVLAMLQLDARASMDLVRAMYHGSDPIQSESAVLALGQSRLPEAFDLLKGWWVACENRARRKTLLLSIAMLRRDTANAFLIATICQGERSDARDAIDALAIYRQDDLIRRLVTDAVVSSEVREVRRRVEEVFGQSRDGTR